MPCILSIETSTNVCSVAVAIDGKNIFEKENIDGPSHATLLGVFVQEAVDYIQENGMALDAVAVSCGPGSYTGLRIGVSEAKGLCYGLNIPLIALNTLKIMASKVSKNATIDNESLLCPMIDARRMEVYAAIYDLNLNIVRDIQADIVDENTYASFLQASKITFFGNGSAKCKDAIKHPNAVFLENIYPTASDMSSLAITAFENKTFEDVAYFEPFYLKEFIATTPKNKIL
ncbi:tRNA (adenosine(37)-N6)-threonylcarbamoyltransferase complex dimerization subunit type 1 TsaB [Dysgonomonas sp. 216]|uniref:tRNA (adenosine(37)-N6)-threonylcarbamoyltransferase complex dimerization subunit type 1 TsaB n=1 Tax=Dysgonomonas sp. 216 TaxID=2302934 RepID=UPI0013D2AEAA|nr:tRNA (adenosine(37)-N6)-threonylcarbamoyltransferase complex dimerization subunit type 1 TsaB [Dysgonomonas sp. 216]NDW19489.1 tRNA (adenosine(37)-N6)-threonylcarbamoyltransferase complex dimerization subunit type 1 TsaB [Dysgonomonas sp. 216]